jgi:hypothetical protein
MYHVFCGKTVSLGYLSHAGHATAKSPAFLKQFGAGGTVNCTVNAPATEQRAVSGIYYGVYVHFGYVVSYNFKWHVSSSRSVLSLLVYHKFRPMSTP